MSCNYKYNGKTYSREGLLNALTKDLSRLTPNATSFLKTKLGMSDNEIVIVNGLIGRGSLGRFKADGRILLSSFADDSVAYHEAFHRVFRKYLTPEERENIVKEFMTRKEWQSKIESLKKLYPNNTTQELIEEYLADEFSDYILNNGNIKIDPVTRSIFDRIIDFIKKILGLSNRNIYDLYRDINAGEFTGEFLPHDLQYNRNADKVIINGNEYSSEVKNDFVQTVGRIFLDRIFETGTVYDLINNSLNADMNELYREAIGTVTEAIIDEHPELANDILDDLEKGTESYIHSQFEQYIKTLGGKFEITYMEQAQEDSTVDDGDANDEKGRQQDDSNPQWVASFQIDPKTSMSKAIKLLLATLEDTDSLNSLGLYSQVRWTQAFNKLAQHLAGIPTSQIMSHLQTLGVSWADTLIDRLGGIEASVDEMMEDFNKFRLRNEFIKTFAKTMNTYAIMSVEDKNIKWFDANQNTKDKKKLQEWNNNLVRAINNQASYNEWITRIENELVKNNNPIEQQFQELLGIDINDDLKEEFIIGNATYMTTMKKIANIILDNSKKKNFSEANPPDFNNLFNEKNFDIKGTLEQLALVQSEYEQVVDLMVNSRGKKLYGISLNTHATTTINTLNYISSMIDPNSSLETKLAIVERYLPEVLNYQTIEKTEDGYKVKSKWLDEILKGNRIDVVIVDGIKNQQGDEDAISDVDEADLLATTLNMSVSGINLSIKHSDRSVYYGYKLSGNPIFDYQQIGAGTPEAILDYLTVVMQDQLSTEVRRANLTDIPLIQYFNKTYKNSSLFDLKNIQNLDPYSDDIRKMIRNKLSEELAKYKEVLDKWKVTEKGIGNDYLSRHAGNVNLLVASSFANQLLTHLEEMKIFLGDFTFFKNADDFYKRMSTTSGTGDLLVNDDLTNQVITQMNDFSFQSINPRTGEIELLRYDRAIDGTFRNLTAFEKEYQSPLATVEDHTSVIDGRKVSQAVYLFEKNMIDDGVNPDKAKQLAQSYANNYKAVNENDGQSWMNMFFFREYMIRLGQWSIEMQNLFIAELQILNAKTEDDIKDITIEIDGKQVKVFEWSNWKKGLFEPVHTLKSQYAGFNQSYIEYRNKVNGDITDMSERIRPYTIYKTSYHVLWPSVIHGTNLSQMHHFMLKNKVDTITMNSANKTGAIDVQSVFKERYDQLNDDQKKVADHGFNFYDQYGHFNDFIFEGQLGNELLENSMVVANINSLKDQVRIGNKEKDEIRGSTQSLKIMLSNLMVNGQPRFEGAEQLVSTYKQIISRLVNKNVERLKEEFGYDNRTITKLDNLVKTIKQSAEDRSSPINIIEAIEGFLHDPQIETLPSKTKMENIFYAIITNNAVVFNRPGNSYPQVAATGFEKLGERMIDDPSKMNISTQSDLKFYSIETDEDGNITKVNPAEVIMPIPKDWIPAILRRYRTKNIAEAVSRLNDDIAKGAVDTDITFKGLRIPNQQLSSNDVVKVKKFTLPTNNNFIVVPSELVTKVGADFDIDKLNIYWNGKSDLFNINGDPDFNDLLEIEKKILLHPRNAHMLFMPVIDDLLKQDARQEIIGRLKRLPLKDPTTFFQALTPHKNVEKGITFVKSKFGVGIVALDITGHAVFMVDNINLSQFYNNPNNDGKRTSTRLLFEGLGNNYSLTAMYDSSGRIISEVQSQIMNSQVDAGKDPYAVGLGINNQTLNMVLYLNRRGVPVITALKFVNQPMIQDYLEMQRENESHINKQRGDELRKSELIDAVYTKHEMARPMLNRDRVITERDLNEGILNQRFDPKQAQMFEYFLALVDEVSAFNDLKNSTAVDTKGKKDRAAVESFYTLQEKVNSTGIVSAESLNAIRNGLLSSFYNAQALYAQLYFPFYAVDQSKFGEPMKGFKDMMEERQKGQYMKDRVRNTIENDFMVFLIQNFHEDFSLEGFNNIFGFGTEESIAKQIQDLQSNEMLRSNPVIQALFPLLSVAKDKSENKLFDALRLFERELNTIDLNDFVDAMKDIRDEVSEELYKSIIQLGIHQAGFMNSPFSLNKIFPTFRTSNRENGNLTDFTNDYLREIQTSIINRLPEIQNDVESLFPQFMVLFYLNNPQFLPKRFWKKSQIKYFYVWNRERGERIIRHIEGNVNNEVQPLGNTYFKRYFLELMPTSTIQQLPKLTEPSTVANDNRPSLSGEEQLELIGKFVLIAQSHADDNIILKKLNRIVQANNATREEFNELLDTLYNSKINIDAHSIIEYLKKLYNSQFNSTSQDFDLFANLQEPSMEDQLFNDDELREAEEKKEECKGTNPKAITK